MCLVKVIPSVAPDQEIMYQGKGNIQKEKKKKKKKDYLILVMLNKLRCHTYF